MSRKSDRSSEDYVDRPPRRRQKGGMSPVAIVLLVVGGVFLILAVGCGGIMWLGYRKAQAEADAEAEAERVEAQRQIAEMDRAFNAAQANPGFPRQIPDQVLIDEPPPPKPGFQPAAEPPPQPKATAFATDDVKNPGRWRILFRSKKPELWNTNTQQGDDFAIPLLSTPEKTKYLRLRRMDTGEVLIIPMTRGRIGRADPPGPNVRWNGEGKDEFGGYHLGIAEGPVARFTEGRGTIGVLMDGWNANPGSGFGHAHHVEDGGQRYSWLGKEIPGTAFEVAVTSGDLTEIERPFLKE
jgi:hypothetical protein